MIKRENQSGDTVKVLVTGGAGFIGHHLVAALLENNCQVNILDTKQVSDEKVEHLVKLGGKYFHGDITNYSDIAEAGNGCTHIVHLAAQTSVPESIQNPKLNNQVNIEGTKNVIRFANENNIEKLVFSSSAAIYGDCRLNPIKEEYRGEIQSPYAVSKLRNEQDLLELLDDAIGVHILRFFNVYGGGQSLTSSYGAVIPSFINLLMSGKSPVIFGDGRQTRDFIHVSDVVKLIAEIIQQGKFNRNCFNVATQTETTISDLLTIIKAKIEENIPSISLPETTYQPERPGDISNSCADIARTKAHYDWEPTISITEGIDSLIKSKVGGD